MKVRNEIFTSWSGFFLGIGAIVVGTSVLHGAQTGWAVLVGLLLLISSAIYGVIRSRVVYPKKIDKEHAYVAGVCPAFLDQLPEWQNE